MHDIYKYNCRKSPDNNILEQRFRVQLKGGNEKKTESENGARPKARTMICLCCCLQQRWKVLELVQQPLRDDGERLAKPQR